MNPCDVWDNRNFQRHSEPSRWFRAFSESSKNTWKFSESSRNSWKFLALSGDYRNFFRFQIGTIQGNQSSTIPVRRIILSSFQILAAFSCKSSQIHIESSESFPFLWMIPESSKIVSSVPTFQTSRASFHILNASRVEDVNSSKSERALRLRVTVMRRLAKAPHSPLFETNQIREL